MEAWVERALKKWPKVPALYGWLRLDRRGRWLIRGEPITRPQIIDTINANYAADERGCWYFQNGPQRGYVSLEVAPLLLRTGAQHALLAHTGQPVTGCDAAFLDQEGSLVLNTDLGPGLLDDQDLAWALERLRSPDGAPLDDAALCAALESPDGSPTGLRLQWQDHAVPVVRCNAEHLPRRLGFVRDPQPGYPDTGSVD